MVEADAGTEMVQDEQTAETVEAPPKPKKPTETVEFWKVMSRKNEAAAKELEELKAATLSKEERIAKEKSDAEAERDAARAEALRWRIAARYGISDSDAELFLTAADENKLIAQAERFTALNPASPPKGTPIPGVGNKPPTPPSIAEQIDAAQASGDMQLAVHLKAQQLAELARNA